MTAVVSGIKKIPNSTSSPQTFHVLTEDQDVLFSGMEVASYDVGKLIEERNALIEERDALIEEKDKYKSKYLKEKADNERLRKLNEQWQNST